MSDAYVHTFASMATVVSIEVVGHGANRQQRKERELAVHRAAAWFQRIEEDCSRFDPRSEISRLSTRVGAATRVSALVFRAVEFALAVAEESGGAFDPTVGHIMSGYGFNRNHRTGLLVAAPEERDASVSYRDVILDAMHRTITLRRELMLDLGAVAKGLAVDMAARELAPLRDFAVDAGGDLYLGGRNADGDPWSVGIRHPRKPDALLDTLLLSDRAVCTSGDYERRGDGSGGPHIIDPRVGALAAVAASVTVVAPSAMVADALATAAFVLGPPAGLRLLDQHGVDGLIVTPGLERFATGDIWRESADSADVGGTHDN